MLAPAYTAQSLTLAALGFSVDASWARQKLRVRAAPRAPDARPQLTRGGVGARQAAADHLDTRDRELFARLVGLPRSMRELYTTVRLSLCPRPAPPPVPPPFAR